MYTYQKSDVPNEGWIIFDPDGDWICVVRSEGQALALLSHLNR